MRFTVVHLAAFNSLLFLLMVVRIPIAVNFCKHSTLQYYFALVTLVIDGPIILLISLALVVLLSVTLI